MATEKQIAANRRNAQQSTGPRTDGGKAASGRNALKHGVLSESVVSDEEDEAKFKALMGRLIEELEPQTAIESTLVERLAILFWRERRLAQAEKMALDSLKDSLDGYLAEIAAQYEGPQGRYMSFAKQLLVGRYQTMLTNQIAQTLKQLRAEQDLRLETIEAVPKPAREN